MATNPHKAEDYTVGWICALPVEFAASAQMLEKRHAPLPGDAQDPNIYKFGHIGEHNIVIGCLPMGDIGKVSAASVASKMQSRFKSIRMGLMVGIGGGVPSENADIRLGDVVVSRPDGQHGGVVQYDLGKTVPAREIKAVIPGDGSNVPPAAEFKRTGSLNSPPLVLLSALANAEADRMSDMFSLSEPLSALGSRLPKFAFPRELQDNLYKPTYDHAGGNTCSNCSENEMVKRDKRDDQNVVIHYGTIASGDQVMKHGLTRDKLSHELGGVLCFEMEAAGLMNRFPCLVIRGICDYADSHKNKSWQPYAAATAAAFARELLKIIPAVDVILTRTINEAMQEIATGVAETTEVSHRVEGKVQTAAEERMLDWISATKYSEPQNQAQKFQTSGTCKWLLNSEKYSSWRDSSSGLLWLYGLAGCGKTVLCSAVIRNLYEHCRQNPTCRLGYWYFQFSDDITLNVYNMIKSLIRQLSTSPLSNDIYQLYEHHQRRGSDPDLREFGDILLKIIEGLKGEVFIVIDALDECPGTGDQSERGQLLRYLGLLLDGDNKHVHVLATSRKEMDIYLGFQSANRLGDNESDAIDVEMLVATDIELFVNSALTKESSLERWDEAIKREIRQKLTGAEERRFRWADLQIKRLINCKTESQLTEALYTIPETLQATYEDALKKIPRKDTETAQKILMWLTSSLRPVTINEIAAAVSLPFPEDVLGICTSLLVTLIDRDTKPVVKLAHFSVKEFLIIKGPKEIGHPWYRFSDISAQITIAKATVLYLLHSNKADVSQELFIQQPLLEYAAEFWYQHMKADPDYSDNSSFMEDVIKLFSREYSGSYLRWLRVYDCDARFGIRNNTKEYLDYPQPLYYASMLGFKKVVTQLLGNNTKDTSGPGRLVNALIAASVNGHSTVVTQLLETSPDVQPDHAAKIVRMIKENVAQTMSTLFDKGAFASPTGDILVEVAIAAAQNEKNGVEAMQVLLERGGPDLPMTPEVVETAAANENVGGQLMTLMLRQRGEDIQINQSVLRKAATNRRSGAEVIAALLKYNGPGFSISTAVLVAAASNETSGADIMRQIFGQQTLGTFANEVVLVAAACNEYLGNEVLEVLLDQVPSASITEDVIDAALANEYSGEKLSTMLLDYQGLNIKITEELVATAARNTALGKELVALLLDRRGADFIVTSDILEAVVNNEGCGEKVLQLLIKRRKPEVHISESVIIGAAANEALGNELMMMLFEFKADLQITSEIMAAAARNDVIGEQVLSLLLLRAGSKFQITKRVVEAAARNEQCGESLLKILLDEGGWELTEKATSYIITNCSQAMVERLLHRQESNQIMEFMIEAAASNEEHALSILALFRTRQTKFRVTEGIFHEASKNNRSGNEFMVTLLEMPVTEVYVSETFMPSIVRNFGLEVITQLLARKSELQITEDIVTAAAASRESGDKVIKLLLSYCASIPITENVIRAAMDNDERGDKVMMLLLQDPLALKNLTSDFIALVIKRFDLTIGHLLLDQWGEEVMQVIGRTFDKDEGRRILCEYQGHFEITEKLVDATAENSTNRDEMMKLIFNMQNYTITANAVNAIVHCFDDEVLIALLETARTDITITAKTIDVARGKHSLRVLKTLLQRLGNDFKVTEDIIHTVADSNTDLIKGMCLWTNGEYKIREEAVLEAMSCQKKTVVEVILTLWGRKVKIDENVLEAAARYQDGEILTILLNQRDNEVVITEKVMIAATGSRRHAAEIMRIFHSRLPEKVPITEMVVVAAAENEWDGNETITLLLNWRRAEIVVTEKVLVAAAGNQSYGAEIITLLLNKQDQQDEKFVISEKLMLAAVGNSRQGWTVTRLLLKLQPAEVIITEMVMVVAAMNWNSAKILRQLCDWEGENVIITEKVMIAAAKSHNSFNEAMAVLLERLPDIFVITKEVVRAFLSSDSSSIYKLGWTNFATIKQLFANPAFLNLSSTRGITILHRVAHYGASNVAAWLLEQNANVHSKMEGGWTPLHVAAERGSLDVAKQLYAKGALLNCSSKPGFTPLHLAAWFGHLHIVRWLVKQKGHENLVSAVSNDGSTPLHLAAKSGDLAIAKELYAKGALLNSVSEHGYTPLHCAVLHGHCADLISWFLKLKEHVESTAYDDEWTPFELAIDSRKSAVAKQLYAEDTRLYVLSDNGFTLLHRATFFGHSDTVSWVVDAIQARQVADGKSSIIAHRLAALSDIHTDIEELCSPAVLPLDARDTLGFTTLQLAFYRDRLDIFESLRKAGADLRSLDPFGYSVLDWASWNPEFLSTVQSQLQGYTPTGKAERQAKLDISILRITGCLRKRFTDKYHWFLGCLADCLLFSGDDENTLLTLLRLAKIENGIIKYPIPCKLCKCLIEGTLYKCRCCPFASLCQSCKQRHENGELVRGCRQHNFLTVWNERDDRIFSEVTADRDSFLDIWLTQLETKYGRAE